MSAGPPWQDVPSRLEPRSADVRIELLGKFLVRTGLAEPAVVGRCAAAARGRDAYPEFVRALVRSEAVALEDVASSERFIARHVVVCEECATPFRATGLAAGDRASCPRCAREASIARAEPVASWLETVAWAEPPVDSSPPSDSRVGFGRIGPYELIERLGSGGMGEVYRAFDRVLGREIAIKILSRRTDLSTGDRVRFFFREIRAAARLRHPNLVAVHQAGSEGGFFYFTMDLVRGRTLRSVIDEDEGRFTVPRAIDLALRLCDAVHYAHGRGIIHRDINPRNVLIDEAGEPLLLDFGVALDSARAGRPSRIDSLLVGTPSYMAPEQIRPRLGADGRPRIDGRCDVYALGAVLYEMLTGSPALRIEPGESFEEFAERSLNSEPVPVTRLEAAIPEHLEYVVRKAMAKDPEFRHESAGELRQDLLRVRSGQLPKGRSRSLRERLLHSIRRSLGRS